MAGELARVVSDHVPLNDGTFAWPKVCCACGLFWPCHSFQRQLQGQSDNRADKMRAHMTVWSLRMLSRPELAFIGPEVSAQLLDWIDGAVAAQDAVDRARKEAQVRAQSAASRLAGRAFNAAGRFMPLGGARQRMGRPPRPYPQPRPTLADLDVTTTGTSRPVSAPNGSGDGTGWSRLGRWRLGRGHPGN
jgi:hypothetical protein